MMLGVFVDFYTAVFCVLQDFIMFIPLHIATPFASFCYPILESLPTMITIWLRFNYNASSVQ